MANGATDWSGPYFSVRKRVARAMTISSKSRRRPTMSERRYVRGHSKGWTATIDSQEPGMFIVDWSITDGSMGSWGKSRYDTLEEALDSLKDMDARERGHSE
jgi:hypothetical protein